LHKPIGGNQACSSQFSKTKSLGHPLIENNQRPTARSLLLNEQAWYLSVSSVLVTCCQFLDSVFADSKMECLGSLPKEHFGSSSEEP
jgi:hypothetical protein